MRIHAVRTGFVQIKRSQQLGVGHGLARRVRPFLDPTWTEWLPTLAWVIEHPEGVIVVDTGSASGDAHLRSWHPYHRFDVRFQVGPQDELGPHLRALGIEARDVANVVLTHLHMDHGAGLPHLAGRPTLVHEGELRAAHGLAGRLQGYLPGQWGPAFRPHALTWTDARFGPFDRTAPITQAGDVLAIPTPGHTPHHVSVVVRGDVDILLAGDASYTQDALLTGQVDGVSPDEGQARATLARIRVLAHERPLVYLPTHDPDSAARLLGKTVVPQ
ncbi:glyoxylase-like metal-dependent hydrolase (beta-lactamase superfamily II) [Deinococcus metalli]|uniref:Glyoxylase-like metal-dependent hydrolase (Beta-lactamase superfamily II) n=1 Tax=Deinococcus metalli TaxID=1141878 RepID=A0A7W8KHW7_9DEIO|nr:N-acyl homoserine lactonase family protein [Deinococcus metalli]MBB5378088.1 glyoxylase-like metal-dependent hydrolase (beta-lactamase superfamily II) [Deinococcus metalli]GHF54330.1 N-acyl homoserine lactonase family protein [Deinococcus metalli]